MNDISEVTTAFNSILFADDSTFLNSINATFPIHDLNKELETNINKELPKIYD